MGTEAGHKHGVCLHEFCGGKGAMAFKEAFDGLYLNNEMEMRSRPLRVHPAAVQGYQANHWHFMRTKIGQKQDSSYSPIFLDNHTLEQKQMMLPPVGMKKLKKQMTEQWQYPNDDRKYFQVNNLQAQSFTNRVAFGESDPVQHQSTAAVDSPKHAKKLRGRQKRATGPAVNYPWSGEQNIIFAEDAKQYANNGNSQHPRGNSQKDVDGMHAVSGIVVLCLACGKPCGGERLSFCPCCSQQFKMQEDQTTLWSDWR